MAAIVTADDPAETGDRASRRLRLDLDDLGFENARLKASIAERQAEIVALSERLGELQKRLDRLDRLAAWTRLFGRLGPWRLLLRRRRDT